MRATRLRHVTAACLIFIGVVVCAPTSGAESYGGASPLSRKSALGVRFSDLDRTIIRQHYLHRSAWPPGLAKKEFPPGAGEKLQRRQMLDWGTVRTPLPGSLELRLTPLPPGYERALVDTDVVILNKRTRMISDVISIIPPPLP